MKISLNWIKDYVALNVDEEALAHKLTMAGFEVEEIISKEGDTVFKLEITPNRPDCLSMIGMAREISAILDEKLSMPKGTTFKKNKLCDIVIEDKEMCKKYIGVLINDVNVGATEKDMRCKLRAIGIRHINNIVDITNFSLMEMGQPLHAFDFDKIEGGKIFVRCSNEGERITTLDGVERVLDNQTLIVADIKKPLAIAGIMGGIGSEVTYKTKNIFLEGAYFDPVMIRRTARKLGLSTDSSYRFERGVDYFNIEETIRRAVALISQQAKGKVVAASEIEGNGFVKTTKMVRVSIDKINAYLGMDIKVPNVKNGLKRLGFGVKENKRTFVVDVPQFRQDIEQEVDVIEEIAHIIGFDNIPTSLPNISLVNIRENKRRAMRGCIAEILLCQGMKEIVSFSMCSREDLEKTKPEKEGLKILNPLSKDQELLRPTLLPSFLSIAAMNINRGNMDLRFFEIGKVYLQEEKETVGILMTGLRGEDNWKETKKERVSFYDLKGVWMQVYKGMDVSVKPIRAEMTSFELGACMQIEGGKGFMGKVKKDIVHAFGIKKRDVYFGEIDLEFIYSLKREDSKKRYKEVGKYPQVDRNVSIAIMQEKEWCEIKTFIAEMVCKKIKTGDILCDIRFLEEYLGDKVVEGKKGLTFSLTYQSLSRTLREEEVNLYHKEIVEKIVDELGVVIR